jgi:hypothetical protein
MDPARRQQRHVYIYIDNSNLWIQGQKTSATAKRLTVDLDPLWRFDVGKLKNVLMNQFMSATYQANFDVDFHVELYGSTPPPVDTVWTAIQSNHVKVNTFSRSKWTGQEKQVDGQLIADATDRATENFFQKIDSEFVLVSGDADLLPAVRKIMGRGFPVHIWSWRNCLAREYRYEKNDQLQVNELDDHLNVVGFRETMFRIDRDIIDPNSVVVLDPLRKADIIETFCSKLQIPVYRYDQKRPDLSEQVDLVIIPAFARQMAAKEWDTFFQHAKQQLTSDGLMVLTHMEYRQRYRDSSPSYELAISKRFSEVQVPQGEDGFGVGDNSRNDNVQDRDNNDGFEMVNRRSERQRKYLKSVERKSYGRCVWGRYCQKLPNCKYAHTKDEENQVKTYGTKTARKYKLCEQQGHCTRRGCLFAHSMDELFCPTCGGIGVGHKMGECIDR